MDSFMQLLVDGQEIVLSKNQASLGHTEPVNPLTVSVGDYDLKKQAAAMHYRRYSFNGDAILDIPELGPLKKQGANARTSQTTGRAILKVAFNQSTRPVGCHGVIVAYNVNAEAALSIIAVLFMMIVLVRKLWNTQDCGRKQPGDSSY